MIYTMAVRLSGYVGVHLNATENTMAASPDGAYLAHISDTVTAMAEQLGEQRETQQSILAVLNLLLETNAAQSEMLADILRAATPDTGPSPVAEALQALEMQVQQMDETQALLIAQMVELPAAIDSQFEISLRGLFLVGGAKP